MDKKTIYDAMKVFLGFWMRPSEFFESLKAGNIENNYLTEYFPELEKLIRCEQDPIHHPEGDVWAHTMIVIDEAAKRRHKVSKPEYFMLAALCHDLGKPDTVTIENGRIHTYGHSKAGVPIAKNFLERIGASEDAIEYVSEMIYHHMDLHSCFDSKSKIKTTNHRFDSVKYPYDLLQLSIADCSGKQTESANAEEVFLIERYNIYEGRSREPMVDENDLIFMGFNPESPEFKEVIASARKMHFSGVNKVSVLKDIIAKNRNIIYPIKAQILLDEFKD